MIWFTKVLKHEVYKHSITIFGNNYILHANWCRVSSVTLLLGNGTDFISDDILATFNPGETTTTVIVPLVMDDFNNEGTEFFALSLRLPNVSMNSELIVNLGTNDKAVASILDVGK